MRNRALIIVPAVSPTARRVVRTADPTDLDVADRIAKRRRATTLIETAARIRIERRVEVLTITAEGARPLADLAPDALLELVRRE
jgi:hypothetical protein